MEKLTEDTLVSSDDLNNLTPETLSSVLENPLASQLTESMQQLQALLSQQLYNLAHSKPDTNDKHKSLHAHLAMRKRGRLLMASASETEHPTQPGDQGFVMPKRLNRFGG